MIALVSLHNFVKQEASKDCLFEKHNNEQIIDIDEDDSDDIT